MTDMAYKIVSRWNSSKVLLENTEVGADLGDANLGDANLGGADLGGADLRDADLRDANLGGADLGGADLRGADLGGADLGDANLGGADLRDANLGGADLRGADLRGADLGDSRIDPIAAARVSLVPKVGQFDGWKKCRGGIVVHVRIPAEARRSSATSRKCRAEFVEVVGVVGGEVGVSIHDGKTTYKVGETVRCDRWTEDRWVECGGGIHFFLTRIEAEHYS
jgi:hypothetical protein